jgi:iron(III) transport system substrate-binding protein
MIPDWVPVYPGLRPTGQNMRTFASAGAIFKKAVVYLCFTLPGATFIMGTMWLSGCGRGPTGPSVVVYTSVDQIYSEPILGSFEAGTGIKVLAVYDVEAAKTTGLVNRLIAEASRPRADVFWNGEFSQTLVLGERGVLAPYHSPAARGLPATYLDPAGYWTGMGGRARVLLVNTKLVSRADYPRSISDLLDSKWPARRIGIANPLFGTSCTQAAALYSVLGPERAQEFYRQLVARGVRVVDGNSVVRDLVCSGELMIGWTDSDDACGAILRGDPVSVVIPDQDSLGTLIIPGTAALVAGAPHPQEGQRLLDYLLSASVEKRLVECGFSQLAPRDPSVRPDCLPVGQMKHLQAALADIQRFLPRVQSELTEIFLR